MTYRRFGNLVQPGRALAELPDLSGKVALVTGGTDGVGRSLVDALAQARATCLLTARDAHKGARVRNEVRDATGNPEVHVIGLDLAQLESVRAASREVNERWDQLDLVLCNAGVMTTGSRPVTADGFESCFGVNHLAHALLVTLLLPQLIAGPPSRLVVVASEAHRRAHGLDLDDLNLERGPFPAKRAYARSKLANVLFARELARRVQGSSLDVRSAHPGGVDTPMMRSQFGRGAWLYPVLKRGLLITPEDAAAGVLRVALDGDLEGPSGSYYELGKLRRGSAASRDAALARALWERSEALLDR